MTQAKEILIVDDEAFIRENLERILAEEGYRPNSTASPEEAVRLVGEEDVDLVLLDLNLGAQSGLDVLRTLKELDPEVLVIIITGYGTVESAVEALKIGAYDYIKKPFKADAIRLIVKLALETQALRRELRHLRREEKGKDMLGSADMAAWARLPTRMPRHHSEANGPRQKALRRTCKLRHPARPASRPVGRDGLAVRPRPLPHPAGPAVRQFPGRGRGGRLRLPRPPRTELNLSTAAENQANLGGRFSRSAAAPSARSGPMNVSIS